ncbi:MAG: geranylgeranyl reductase family protein [Coxiellaceae bacterium]|nr:geranylgeranyl reductase family protein [Coxiellaceae bacterium]
MPNVDVIIVGSGPAGSCCAIECAQKGLKVAVVEKKQHPRIKVCGGGVVKRAYDLFPIDISLAVEQTIYETDLVWHKSNLCYTASSDSPYVYMVMRSKLDKLLADHAKQLGVQFFENTELTSLSQNEQGVSATADDQTFNAKWLIAADGASGNTARLAGWSAYTENNAPAVEAEVEVTDEAFERLNRARFDFEAIPQGYGWLFPKKHHLSIGVGCFHFDSKKAASPKTFLKEYYQILGLKDSDILSVQQKGFVVPLRARPDGFNRGRVLLVGDAGGFADPLTAEGISAAIISGRLAASTISSATSAQQASDMYQHMLQEELLTDLHFSAKLSHWLYTKPKLVRNYLKLRKQAPIQRAMQIFSGELRFSELYKNATGWKKFVLEQMS